MSVLVTGASGLVGSHVVEALAARGEPVRALVRPASRGARLLRPQQANGGGRGARSGDASRPRGRGAAPDGHLRRAGPSVHARVLRAARLRFVPQIGPGTNRLSCVYAGNVASAAVAALDAPLQGFRPYNVTSDGPPALSQREFFAAFAAALGRRTWSIPIPMPLAGLVIGLFTARRLARAAVSFASGDHPYTDQRLRAELGL